MRQFGFKSDWSTNTDGTEKLAGTQRVLQREGSLEEQERVQVEPPQLRVSTVPSRAENRRFNSVHDSSADVTTPTESAVWSPSKARESSDTSAHAAALDIQNTRNSLISLIFHLSLSVIPMCFIQLASIWLPSIPRVAARRVGLRAALCVRERQRHAGRIEREAALEVDRSANRDAVLIAGDLALGYAQPSRIVHHRPKVSLFASCSSLFLLCILRLVSHFRVLRLSSSGKKLQD